MTHTRAMIGLLAASLAVASMRAEIAEDTARRNPRNAAEFEQMFRSVSNWNRWGATDQLGAANLVTEEKRRQATALAKSGISVSLAHRPLTEIAADNPNPFEHTMNRGFTTDTYKVSYHGTAHSHIDALCHFSFKDQDYNGYPRSEVNVESGCTKLGIENLQSGVITRGILIDVPRLKQLSYLEPSTAVFTEDLEAWERQAHVKIGPGDAIFLRTGRWARRAALGPWNMLERASGFHVSVAPWLKARGVAIIGSDEYSDVVPSRVEGVRLPVHTMFIAALGIHLLDNQDLERLAETTARLNRWEFMVAIAPVPVSGGTGSPVNTLAVF